MNMHSSSSTEKARLENCLRQLVRGRGVWRDDLIELLRGDLSELQQRWSINISSGREVARVQMAIKLDDYIEHLYPDRWDRQVRDLKEVENYRLKVRLSFNIGRGTEFPHQILDERLDLLKKKYRYVAGMSKRTARRDLERAAAQIAELMISGAELPSSDGPAASDTTPAPATSSSAPSTAPRLHQLATPSYASIAHLLVLSGELRSTLETVRDTCRQQKRPFYTSDTLIALLNMPSHGAWDCFNSMDETETLAGRVQQKYQSPPTSGGRAFREFEWVERDEFELALEHAMNGGQAVVNEFHLLLAILDGQSETNLSLKRFLQQGHAEVRAAAKRGCSGGCNTIKTPMWD